MYYTLFPPITLCNEEAIPRWALFYTYYRKSKLYTSSHPNSTELFLNFINVKVCGKTGASALLPNCSNWILFNIDFVFLFILALVALSTWRALDLSQPHSWVKNNKPSKNVLPPYQVVNLSSRFILNSWGKYYSNLFIVFSDHKRDLRIFLKLFLAFPHCPPPLSLGVSWLIHFLSSI